MIKQTWEINEDEKNRILNLHESATKNLYLVTEQQTKPIKQFNITNSFKSGQYQLINTSEIDSAISEINNISTKTPNVSYDVIVTSSESKVPNRGVNMEPGELSLKRGQTAEQYLKSKLGDKMVVKVNNLGAQGPEWNPSKGNDNPEYTKYQYVTIGLVVSGGENKGDGSGESMCNLNIDGAGKTGIPEQDYVTNNVKLKDKGTLTFITGSIPDRLIIVDNQNNIVKDTGYVATEPHKYTSFKYVPVYVAQLTKLNGSKAVSGSKIITINAENYQELLKQLLVDPNITPSKEEIREMGTEVSNGLYRLQKLSEKGVKTFVLYTITNGPTLIPVDTTKGDSSVIVMSPIGQTGYTITGKC